MGSELTPEALRLVEGLLSGKSLVELAPQGDPARKEIVRHLESLLSNRKKPKTSDAPGAAARVHNMAILFSDGASRGNPGPAAIGFLLQDATGNELAAEGECIGTTTNNIAEYQAVFAGLQKARDLGIEELEIRLDSQLVERQLNGEYKVRHPGLLEWKRRVDDLLRMFRSVRIIHIGREENTAADRLANEALDREQLES